MPRVKEIAGLLQSGKLNVSDIAEACLENADEKEGSLQAFAHLDPAIIRTNAKALDRVVAKSALHGVPVAIKDIFDTKDEATAYNSPIYAAHQPAHDAAIVARLRELGALIFGKTVTAEFAHTTPGPTANPVLPQYSPGGSSSGSAAAVGAGIVSAALGSQTGGSTIRPASYCGVVGFKPTHGKLDAKGMKPLAPSFDTVGIFASNVADAQILYSCLADEVVSAPPTTLRVGLFEAREWGKAEDCARAALQSSTERAKSFGWELMPLQLAPMFAGLPYAYRAILNSEAAISLDHEYRHHKDQLSPAIVSTIEAGKASSAETVAAARACIAGAQAELDHVFDRFDLILTYSAPGEAPLGKGGGDACFNRAWSTLGVPCLNIPAVYGPNGLPVGVQLIARRGADDLLLAAGQPLDGT